MNEFIHVSIPNEGRFDVSKPVARVKIPREMDADPIDKKLQWVTGQLMTAANTLGLNGIGITCTKTLEGDQEWSEIIEIYGFDCKENLDLKIRKPTGKPN